MFLPGVAYPMTAGQRLEIAAMHIAYVVIACMGVTADFSAFFSWINLIVMGIGTIILLSLQALFFRGIKAYPKDSLPDLSRRVADIRHEEPLGPLWYRTMASVRVSLIFIGAYLVFACFISGQGQAMESVFSVMRVIAWVGFSLAMQRAWRNYENYAKTERRLLGVVA